MSDILDDLKMMADHLDRENGDEPCDLGMLLIRAIAEIRKQREKQPVGESWSLDETEISLLHQLASPDDDGDYSPLTLRVGHVREDDGTVRFGLLCEYTDYPEEGATLLVERSPAPQPVGEPAENSYEWFQREIQRLQQHVAATWPDWMKRTSGLSTATFQIVGEVPMPEAEGYAAGVAAALRGEVN
jgi:hypothetical protein